MEEYYRLKQENPDNDLLDEALVTEEDLMDEWQNKLGGIFVKSDIQIANEATIEPIFKIAQSLGIEEEDLEYYGRYKAKLSNDLWNKI